MRKLEKAEVVQAIQAKVAKSQIGILTDFKGLKVADMTRLRRQLQEADAELTVVKNTLLRRGGGGGSLNAGAAGEGGKNRAPAPPQ